MLPLGEAIEAQRSAAAACNTTLHSELLPDTPPILADRERIGLVLANLLGNAIRYGPASGTVTIRAIPQDGVLRFEVSDEGPGIPAEYQQAIFDKYGRVPGAAAGGAGLGLFIARELAQCNRAALIYEPRTGGGSIFRVVFADPQRWEIS